MVPWNLCSLPQSEESAILWLREQGLLRINKNCGVHRKPMKLYNTDQHGVGRFLCVIGKSKCRQFAGTIDSFFEDVQLPYDKAIKVMYCFTRDMSYEDAMHEVCNMSGGSVDESSILSSSTINAWFRYCREMIIDHFQDIQLGKPKLGGKTERGLPIVVEIEEAKFGKRKYNRGRIVDGHWVLGLIDTHTRDSRMMVVPNREASTLISIIKERAFDPYQFKIKKKVSQR